jgi:hypothetical protein
MKTLLAIISIIQEKSGKPLFAKLLSKIILMAGLLLVTAIMISAMLIGGLINAQMILLNSGIAPHTASVIIGTAALFIIIVLIAVIVCLLRSLRRVPQKLYGQSPLAVCLAGTLDAFIAGLMKK